MTLLKFTTLFSLFFTSLTFAHFNFNPVGVYRVFKSIPQLGYGETVEEFEKKCPNLLGEKIIVTAFSAKFLDKEIEFEIWDEGEDEYWSLGRVRQTENSFLYETRGMGQFTTFGVFKNSNSYTIKLRRFFSFQDSTQWSNRNSEICDYKLSAEKL